MYLREKQFIKSNVRSSQIYIMIIFVIFSIQILMRTVSSESCDKLFPKDNGLTMVRSIRQGSDLNNYLSGTYNLEKGIDYLLTHSFLIIRQKITIFQKSVTARAFSDVATRIMFCSS